LPEHFDLDEFRSKRFHYRAGHHLAAFGPTQIAGKTTLAFSLLEQVVHDELPATVLVMKHRDRTVSGWTQRLGFQETPQWPPHKKLTEVLSRDKPRGYTLWPRQTLTNVEADNARLEREFKAAITHNLGNTPSITFADEIYGLIAELDLRTLLTAVVTRDSGAGHGLWYASQKPSGTQGVSMPGFMFNSAEHMFLSRDGEERNRVRYGEIACGIDPREIERQTLALQPFSWLYIRRSGPVMCVVDAYDSALAM
jgi:hypothetical protein